jgi:cytochrome P450
MANTSADGLLTPLGRALAYRLISAVLHQPGLLRLVGAAHRRWARLTTLTGMVAGRDAVVEAFLRDNSFSNTAHAPKMPAGEFIMGMESCPRHRADREFLDRSLPEPALFGQRSAEEARARIASLRQRDGGRFDLVEDYMVWVAWSGLREGFGSAAAALESHTACGSARDSGMLAFFHDLRHLGAQLIVGTIAPRPVVARAERSGGALRRHVADTLPALRDAWAHAKPHEDVAVQRNGVGLGWVGHPAMVQCCALMMQELLKRPSVYRRLRERAQALGDAAWTDADFRAMLRAHVLELMRFRPAFPLLMRDVPRETSVRAGENRRIEVPRGQQLKLLAIGAMFDPRAVTQPHRFWPERPDRPEDDQMLPFGFGPRRCVGHLHVLEVLVSALTGLLLLPRLRWADPWWTRIRYDGPIVSRMRLRI